MATFRVFKNSDPPKIVELWNQTGRTRGFGRIAGCDNLERFVFSKPYFDRNGLILAFEGDELVGLCHAGFGCNDDSTGLDKSMGTIAMLIVRPDRQRRGLGGELLKQGQKYLRDNGASVLYIGCLNPVNPFYLGLYGGSELPGVLESDDSMTRFAQKHGHQPADTCMAYQLNLDELAPINDPRAPLLRRQVEVQVEPWPMPLSWWHACLLGPMVSLGYDMQEKSKRKQIGRAWVWEMETHSSVWKTPAVGLTDVLINESFQKQGYGRLMLHSILKHLQGQKIGLVEVQTMSRNAAARKLYESLGFRHVDTGHIYRLGAGPSDNIDLQDTAEFPPGSLNLSEAEESV